MHVVVKKLKIEVRLRDITETFKIYFVCLLAVLKTSESIYYVYDPTV